MRVPPLSRALTSCEIFCCFGDLINRKLFSAFPLSSYLSSEMGAFNANQSAVLASMLDAAFQAHSPAEVEEILRSLPASATKEQREAGQSPLLCTLRSPVDSVQ